MRVAFYARVSTAQQTTDNQLQELERVAALRGWNLIRTYRDDGISGAKGRAQRPALDQMLKAAARREFDLIVWRQLFLSVTTIRSFVLVSSSTVHCTCGLPPQAAEAF